MRKFINWRKKQRFIYFSTSIRCILDQLQWQIDTRWNVVILPDEIDMVLYIRSYDLHNYHSRQIWINWTFTASIRREAVGVRLKPVWDISYPLAVKKIAAARQTRSIPIAVINHLSRDLWHKVKLRMIKEIRFVWNVRRSITTRWIIETKSAQNVLGNVSKTDSCIHADLF